MESISVAIPLLNSATYMRAFRLSATVSLLLVLLPSLIFSLVLLALFSLILLLPIVCMFASIFLFSSIFFKIPVLALARKSLNRVVVVHTPLTCLDIAKKDLTVDNTPECLVFDRSEVPFEEEGTEGDEEEEEEISEGKYQQVRTKGEEIDIEQRDEDENVEQEERWNSIKISQKDWGHFRSFSSLNCHEGHGFHGILAFWRRKESEAEEVCESTSDRVCKI